MANTLKAFLLERYGDQDGVREAEIPEPEVRDDDVLVQVHAAGVNLLDSKIRDGEFKLVLPYRLPLVLGNDVAGVVMRVGSRVRRFKVGDEVYARPNKDRIGTFAELIAVNEADLAPKPKTLTMEEAASIPLVGLTAWRALIEEAHLKKGQKVLIHAGSGGVGTFAIQLAKHIGAFVATTTSTANVDWVKRLGADLVVDYKNPRSKSGSLAFENASSSANSVSFRSNVTEDSGIVTGDSGHGRKSVTFKQNGRSRSIGISGQIGPEYAISEAQTDETAQDARTGIAWWNHLTPTQRSYWLTCARSSAPADAWIPLARCERNKASAP
ncbi:MAG TPA: NADP-dependent oxidoreductase [Steroidobacteraceae bacterium]